MRVASDIKGLKLSEWTRLKYSFATVLLTSVLILISPKINGMQNLLKFIKKFTLGPVRWVVNDTY